MKKIIISVSNQNQTLELANKIATYINDKQIIVLTGELGSGKTKFVEGFLTHFGMQDEISSPTFNIVNEYTSNNINIYHFDVYRLEDSNEFFEFGGEEYFEKGICLIEWGEIIQDILPNDFIQIIFQKDFSNENKRSLEFKLFGNTEKYINILEKIKEELN